MRVSPGDNSGSNAVIVLSVTSPAGTISHNDPRRLELGDQRVERGGGSRALLLDQLAGCFRRIETDHLMAAAQQPLRHVGAHAAKTNHRNFHSS